MRPMDALPSMIIIGNSVPPPSMRCTLLSWGHWYFPNSESSHASASTVFWTAFPWPQVVRSPGWRSEEHTSELQSRSDLVCRLLLEKKKKQKYSRYLLYTTKKKKQRTRD